MTAGTGIMHSEFNPSEKDDVHLYQIWIFPDKKGLKPSYEQIQYDRSKAVGDFLLLASNEENSDTVRINQDIYLYLSVLPKGTEVKYIINRGRDVWIQVVRGEIDINGKKVSTADGVAVTNETLLTMKATDDSEVLLFDM